MAKKEIAHLKGEIQTKLKKRRVKTNRNIDSILCGNYYFLFFS